MPAGRVNFIVLYKGVSQVFGCASKGVALKSPPPDGVDIEDKIILFTSLDPDSGELAVYRMPQEEVVEGYKEALEKKKAKADA